MRPTSFRTCLLVCVVLAIHAAQPVAAQYVQTGIFCRRVRDDATALSLTALDGSAGPAVAPGQELQYAGIKLHGPGDAWWAVVYGENRTVWKYDAMSMAYCDPPECEAKEGSQYHSEEGTSCTEDADCCRDVACVDHDTYWLAVYNSDDTLLYFSREDPSALLPKTCIHTQWLSPGPSGSEQASPAPDGGDSAGSSSGDVDFIPGLDKCGTPEFDAAASKADLQAYFQSNGEAAAAACASAALDDFASICDCYVVLDNWMELSCPPCVKTEIERMMPLECRTALSQSTSDPLAKTLFDFCGIAH